MNKKTDQNSGLFHKQNHTSPLARASRSWPQKKRLKQKFKNINNRRLLDEIAQPILILNYSSHLKEQTTQTLIRQINLEHSKQRFTYKKSGDQRPFLKTGSYCKAKRVGNKNR